MTIGLRQAHGKLNFLTGLIADRYRDGPGFFADLLARALGCGFVAIARDCGLVAIARKVACIARRTQGSIRRGDSSASAGTL